MSDFQLTSDEKDIEIIIPSDQWSEMQSTPNSTDESPLKRRRFEHATFQETTGSSQQHLQGINGLLQLNKSLVNELMPLKTNYEKLKKFVKIFSETNSFLQERIKNAKLLSLQLFETLDIETQLNRPVRTDVDTPNTIHNYAMTNQINGSTCADGAVTLEKIDRNLLPIGIKLLDEVPPMSKHILESSRIIDTIPERPTVVPSFIQYFAQNFNEIRKDKLRAEALFTVYRIDSLIGVSVGPQDRVAHFWFWNDYSVICPVCSRVIHNNLDKHISTDHYAMVDGLRLRIKAKLNSA